MWLVGGGDLLLIGTNGDAILPRLDQLATAWQRGSVPAALSEVGIKGGSTPFALLSLFAGGPDEILRYGEGALIQTDDRMALEFSAPRGIYGRMANENSVGIRALTTRPIPVVQTAFDSATDVDWTTRGTMELRSSAYEAAYDAFKRASSMNAYNAEALNGLSRAAAETRKLDEAKAWMEATAKAQPSNVPIRLELSRLLASMGDFDGAATHANDALKIAPDDAASGEQLASVLTDAGDGERLLQLAQALLARYPERPDAKYYMASARFLNGDTRAAVDEARKLVAQHPDHARGHNLLGAACATEGDRDCARTAFAKAIELNPRDASTYVNLGMLLIQSGDSAGASKYFAEALTIDPNLTGALEGLAQARSILRP
jgi:Flp pilus assembly protein TadD